MFTEGKATDILGYGSIGKLLFNYSLPAIASMSIASLFNIIDRIFIGQGVGSLAIAGLAITFPIMNLASAFGSLVGSGASTMISIRLGEQRTDSATRFLGNAVVVSMIIGGIFTGLGLYFLDPILFAFGASENTIMYARDFMQVILCGNIFSHTYFCLNNILRATGYPKKAMKITIMTVGVNLILAPVFIFWLHWGIKGAAWATVIAQITGLMVVITHYFNKNNTLYFREGFFELRAGVVGRIFEMGMSSFLINVCASAVVIVLNFSLKKHGGDLAIGAYGIINSILGLVALVIFGFNMGMQPIAGYNYGAKQYDRVLLTLKYSLVVGTCISVFGFLLGELFPWYIARSFTNDETLIRLTVEGLRITILLFPLVGSQIVAASFFQAVGKPKISIFLSISRQILFLIPALFLLPNFFGLRGVWIALPISDLIASALTVFVLYVHYKNMKRKIAGQRSILQ
ncbi:MAG: MATE family efflux transporter [Bacteroidales bacterium]|jgi:putative MATE family efflux protein|nr:MATE family efflux transporter [Bacteroidales bacterium]